MPRKRVTYKKKLHKKSKWITNGILRSINKKDKLYKTLIQTDLDNTVLYDRLKTEFKDYRASLRKIIRKAKRDYYTHIFNRHKNDIKKTWSLINETLNRNLKKQSTHEFLINDEMISDPIIIAIKFNQYFAHIGSTLADKIPSAPHFNSYLSNPVDSVFSFHTVTEENISLIINKPKYKVSYGHDSISNIMIKRAHKPLIKPLTLLINQTLYTGIFPNDLKISRIRLLFKQGVLLCFQTTGLFLYCHHYLKYTSMLYLSNFYFIWRTMDYSITINLGLDQVILQNLHQYDLLIHWFNKWTILIYQ